MSQTTTDHPAPTPAEENGTETKNKCVSVIFNPVSGKSDPNHRQKVISDALAHHGYTCQFIATTKERGATELAQETIRGGDMDLLAVSGGDGTVMEVLSALVGSDIPVAVLPAGTGNLLSANLGIPTTVPEAVHVALSGLKYRLDLAQTGDGRYFAIMGGLGLDGKVIADADRTAKDRLGVLAYFVAAAKNLARHRASVTVTLDDGAPLHRRAKSVVIANMGKITGGLEAIPTASPTDGKLDVGILKARTFGQAMRLMGYALLGRAQDAPDLDVYQATRIRIQTREDEPVQFDGEEGGTTRDLSVHVVPGAVYVLIPENAPAARDSDEPPALVARKSAARRLVLPAALLTAGLVGIGLWTYWRRRRR